MDDTPSVEDERPAQKRRPSRLGLQIVATFLVLLGIGAILSATYGLRQGWLLPTWSKLTDAQGSILASCVTLYAAALAATIGPLIFTGQISSMQAASEQTLSAIEHQVQRLTEQLEHVRKLVRQTEESIEPVNVTTAFEPEKALLRLEGIREDATALAQSIVEKSSKWASTKEKTRRKWPGRKPYYNVLCNLGFIDESQRDLFTAISDTRLLKTNDVTMENVIGAEENLAALKRSAGLQ